MYSAEPLLMEWEEEAQMNSVMWTHTEVYGRIRILLLRNYFLFLTVHIYKLIIKHEIAWYISFVKHQLFKVNMSLSVFAEKQGRAY